MKAEIKRFNSSMVRLEVIKVPDLSKLIMFQFQYGSIRRKDCNAERPLYLCFNSSMVRLEANQ